MSEFEARPFELTATDPAGKVKEITERLEQGVKDLFESERYQNYLKAMSKFHDYSLNNTLLILMQKPDASLVAGFGKWKTDFERHVKAKEKGIKIFAPAPYTIKKETEKIDQDTGQPVIGTDGKPVMEQQEIKVPAFKVVSVFDVSQTEGKEIPNIAAQALTGSVEQYEDFFKALELTFPVPIGFEKIDSSAHGYYHLEDKRIALNEGESELQTVKTLIHEIAHAKLHDIDLTLPPEQQENRPNRRTREVEAESVAYTVCQHFGLDTSDYSFGYVAGWSSDKDIKELKASLETIRTAAGELIAEIEGHFRELQQQREAQTDQIAEQEAVYLLDDNAYLYVQASENGYDYTLYDRSLSEIDGGQLDNPALSMTAARDEILALHELTPQNIDNVFLAQFEQLREAAEQHPVFESLSHDQQQEIRDTVRDTLQMLVDMDMQNNGEVSRETLDALEAQGCMIQGGAVLRRPEPDTPEKIAAEIFNLTQEADPELMQKYEAQRKSQIASTVESLLHNPNDTAAIQMMLLDMAENGSSEEIRQRAAELNSRIEAFEEKNNTFSIYQLKGGEETRAYRFEPLEDLHAAGLVVQRSNYDRVYTAPLSPLDTLEDIFVRFNMERPQDFTGHSLSMSDIIVLRHGEHETAHYLDRGGYTEVPEFLQQELTAQRWNGLDGIINDKPFMPDATPNAQANALIDHAERDGQRMGNAERGLVIRYHEALQDLPKTVALINELCEQGFEQQHGHLNYLVKQRIDAEITAAEQERMSAQQPLPPSLDPAVQPIVTIIWSESEKLREGEQMPLARADALFQKLDEEKRFEREQPGYAGGWYDKTKFRIDCTFDGERDSYEGRQDFGDGDGSLIDHIRSYHEYYAQDENWKKLYAAP